VSLKLWSDEGEVDPFGWWDCQKLGVNGKNSTSGCDAECVQCLPPPPPGFSVLRCR